MDDAFPMGFFQTGADLVGTVYFVDAFGCASLHDARLTSEPRVFLRPQIHGLPNHGAGCYLQ